jgi:class 3 adenylate cyclase
LNTNLPSGTVTFLFTDIEGSTSLWEQHAVAMQDALARHDNLLRNIIEAHGGHIVKKTGDGLHAVFAHVQESLTATLACQQALISETWPGLPYPLRVRMALHTGETQFRDGDYFGSAVNRAARLMAIASGGQILLSSATTEIVRDQLPADAALYDLGEHRLKDLIRPERVFQVSAPDLPTDFPPLRSLNALRRGAAFFCFNFT